MYRYVSRETLSFKIIRINRKGYKCKMFHMKHLIQFLYIDMFHVKLYIKYKNVPRETISKFVEVILL